MTRGRRMTLAELRGWPEWVKDEVRVEIDHRPSIADRLRILFSGRLLFSVTTYVDQELRHVQTIQPISTTLFPWESWWRRQNGRNNDWQPVPEAALTAGSNSDAAEDRRQAL